MADRWHPILETRETEFGLWYLIDSLGKPYGVVRIVQRGDEFGYRAVTYAPESVDRKLIGYYRTLLSAVMAAHMHLVHNSGPTGIPAAGYAGAGWDTRKG